MSALPPKADVIGQGAGGLLLARSGICLVLSLLADYLTFRRVGLPFRQ
jgi:hypothetical protein